MKLLLVDDHQLFLDGLSQLLAKHLHNCHVLTASNVIEAKNIIGKHENLDLILVDLHMPDVDGFSLIEHLQTMSLIIPVAVLSATEELDKIQQALNRGALGFIPKNYAIKSLISAIFEIINGGVHVPTNIRQGLKRKLSSQLQAIEQYEITTRQLEVLSLIEQGLTNIKIANSLFITEHTVKSHVKQIFQKLDSINRVDCINKAKTLGIL